MVGVNVDARRSRHAASARALPTMPPVGGRSGHRSTTLGGAAHVAKSVTVK